MFAGRQARLAILRAVPRVLQHSGELDGAAVRAPVRRAEPERHQQPHPGAQQQGGGRLRGVAVAGKHFFSYKQVK